jgi:hypothetical protein
VVPQEISRSGTRCPGEDPKAWGIGVGLGSIL